MPDAPQTTPFASSSIHDDFEVPPSVPEKKPLLPIVSSWLVSLVRRKPFLSSAIISAILICSVAGVVQWSYYRDIQSVYQVIPPGSSGVALIGHSYQLDTISQTLSIEWEVLGCGEYKLTTYPPMPNVLAAVGCDSLNRAVDVYLNGAPNATYSYDPAGFPMTLADETRRVYELSVFDVGHSIDYIVTDMVPFDAYGLTVFVFVIDKATNRSLPIATFAAGEGPDNFVVSSSGWSVKSNYTYDSGTGPTTVEVESSLIYIEARESQLAQAFTMCMLLVNWALTVGSTYITLLVIFRGEGTNEAVLLLPVTIVLTIPTIRSLYVGSPPFGIFIDTFGFFLQMMIVAVCSMVLVYVLAVSKSMSKQRASRDDGAPNHWGNA